MKGYHNEIEKAIELPSPELRAAYLAYGQEVQHGRGARSRRCLRPDYVYEPGMSFEAFVGKNGLGDLQ